MNGVTWGSFLLLLTQHEPTPRLPLSYNGTSFLPKGKGAYQIPLEEFSWNLLPDTFASFLLGITLSCVHS